MTYAAIILTAAAKVKISGALLLAICTHETNLTNVVTSHDGGSPSIGICQVKENTARMLGFKGIEKDLMIPSINAKWAARYLKYQMNRYGENDWCKLASAYNSGTYNESKRHPGKPRNFGYVRKVQKKLAYELQDRLSCESGNLAEAK